MCFAYWTAFAFIKMVFLPVIELSNRLKSNVRRFLLTNEKSCVQLVSVLRRTTNNAYAVFENTGSTLMGIVNIKQTILFLLPFAEQTHFAEQTQKQPLFDEFIDDFATFYKSKGFAQPACINGPSKGAALFLKAFSKIQFDKPQQINSYHLMYLSESKFTMVLRQCKKSSWYTQFSKDTKIIRCKKKMENANSSKTYEQLCQLQIAYEQEEVIPASWTFDEHLCRLRLANSLQKQYILALEKDHTLISKVGTNAIGYKYVQLGGIYTAVEHRGNHYAKLLLQLLCKKLLSAGKTPSLFVKQQNQAAIQLYKSIGFIKNTDYTIAYFNQNV